MGLLPRLIRFTFTVDALGVRWHTAAASDGLLVDLTPLSALDTSSSDTDGGPGYGFVPPTTEAHP